RQEVIAEDSRKDQIHRPLAEIFATVVAGSLTITGSHSLVGGRWLSYSGAALPQYRTFGSASDSPAETAGPSTAGPGEAYSVGNRRHCGASALARCVLSTRSCRTIYAATTRHPFRALLRRCTRRSEWLVHPCLGTRRRSRGCWG